MLAKVKALEQIEDDQMRESKLVELASKVVDALCDEALKIAIDIGVDEVAAVGGITTLVAAIESHVSQFKDDEAHKVFAIGSKADGELSRQRIESMVSYITRRKRWVIRLTDLDSNTKLSDVVLAGLCRTQRVGEVDDQDCVRQPHELRGDRGDASPTSPEDPRPR